MHYYRSREMFTFISGVNVTNILSHLNHIWESSHDIFILFIIFFGSFFFLKANLFGKWTLG